MSWEDILKNVTKEAEQFFEDYLSAFDVWSEEHNKITQQQLETLEEGHESLINIKEKHPEFMDISAVKDIHERARESSESARKSIYAHIDMKKLLMKSIGELRQAAAKLPIYNVLDLLIKDISPDPLIPEMGEYPASPSYDLQKAEDLLHRLSFEGSDRRDFT